MWSDIGPFLEFPLPLSSIFTFIHRISALCFLTSRLVTHADRTSFLVCITSFFVISCLTSRLKWRTPAPLTWLQFGPPAGAPLIWQQVCPGPDFIHISSFMQRPNRQLEPSGSFLWSRVTSSRCQCATRPYSCFDLFQFHFLQLWLLEWKIHVAQFGTGLSHCWKSVQNISVGVDPSVGIKTWLRCDDATVGPSVTSRVSVQWNSLLHSMELQQKRMRQLPNQPPKTSFNCFLWFRREIWFVAWTALTERAPRDVWVKIYTAFPFLTYETPQLFFQFHQVASSIMTAPNVWGWI